MLPVTFEPPLTYAIAAGQGENYPLSVRMFDWRSDRLDLFRLRYRAYLASGWLQPSPDQLYRDAYDDLTTTISLGVHDGTTYVGSLRLCFSPGPSSPDSLPCAPHYSEVRRLRQELSGPIVEISRLAIDPALRGLSFKTTVYGTLIRASCLVYESAGSSFVLVAAHQRLQAFYKRMLGFSSIGGPAPYPPGNEPIVILGADIAGAKAQRRTRNAFFKFSDDELTGMRRAIDPMLARFG